MQRILTGNEDVDYKILQYLDVQDLSATCRSSQYAQQLCDSNTFWRNKFRAEGLPFYDYHKDFTVTDWLITYKQISTSKQKAIWSLMINDIEFHTTNTRFAINIWSNTTLLSTILSYIVDKSMIDVSDILVEQIAILVTDEYLITLYYEERGMKQKDIVLNKDQVIELLTFAYQYTWPYDDNLTIESEKLPLIVTQAYINSRYHEDDDIPLLYERKGMLESIQYFKRLKENEKKD